MEPDSRRRQLAEIAGRLFAHGGFRQVPLAEIARAAGMTAPAIYRHYSGKQALLAASMSTGLDLIDDALRDTPVADWDGLITRIGDICWLRRDLWILLQRETSQLDGPDRIEIDDRVRVIFREIVDRIGTRDPQLDPADRPLIVMSVLAVLSSVSTAHSDAPQSAVVAQLSAISASVADCVLPQSEHVAASPGPPEPPTDRGEQLLQTAVQLFHERDYASVSLDEVGAAVGVAGPSIYYHFASKEHLLAEAFRRASLRLTPPAEDEAGGSLESVVHRWVELAVGEPALFGVYITESRNLSPRTAREMAGLVAANVAEWADALRLLRPGLSGESTSLRVNAARAIVNDVVGLRSLVRRPHIRAELVALCLAALLSEID